MLDATTWRDPAIIALLKEKTIALKIDAEKNVDLAKRYSIESYPTLALIRPDGTVIDTLFGYQDAKTFTGNFESSLAGKTSLMRAREAVEKARGGNIQALVQARYDLGVELAEKGQKAEALAEYLWCFDDGMKNAQEYSGVRVSFLLTNISNLGKHYPPALEALKARRDKARADLLASSADSSAARDLSSINHALGKDQVTLSYFDQLPPESSRRAAIGEYIFDMLLAAQRYGDAISALPYTQYKAQFKHLKEAPSPPGESDLIRGFIITDAGKEMEALAGAGKLDDARDLLKTALEYDRSPATIATLRDHLKRAGHAELMLAPAGNAHSPAG